MATQQSKTIKTYTQKPFVLTSRKFARIVEIAKERIERIKGELSVVERFVVTLTNTKDMTLNQLEDVLALDNSVKNPVMEIKYSIWAEDGDQKRHWIVVDFDAASTSSPIQILAASDNLGWMQETVGALEEQVERTIPSDFVYSIRRLPILSEAFVLIPILGATLVAFFLPHEIKKTGFGISEVATRDLQSIAGGVKTDSEKLDFIFRYLVSTVQPKPSEISIIERYATDYRTYLVGVPLLVAVLSAVAAFQWFYPLRVFVWGDYEEHYNKLVERRRFIWYGVVAALLIGVLGNFFVLGVTSNMPIK